MRQIKKRAEPEVLTQFRAECKAADRGMKEEKAKNRTDPAWMGATSCHTCGSNDRKTFWAMGTADVVCVDCGAKPKVKHYSQMSNETRSALLQSLLEEQGWLCAYTGLRIQEDERKGPDAHIEHLKAQEHCGYGEDVEYSNMVACYPRPNYKVEPPYGAVPKKNWPDYSDQSQVALFVSPLSNGCESRFSFAASGKISASSPTDAAAVATIQRLRLDHEELTAYRKAAIRATLSPNNKPFSLSVASAQLRLDGLRRSERSGAKLEQFCFVLRQALERHIERATARRDGKLKRR